jgi:hypothetical protein
MKAMKAAAVVLAIGTAAWLGMYAGLRHGGETADAHWAGQAAAYTGLALLGALGGMVAAHRASRRDRRTLR